MKKEAIEQSLLDFFGLFEKEYYLPGFMGRAVRRPVRPDDFIIFGGAALVLQDRTEEASDIDMFSPAVNIYMVSHAARNSGPGDCEPRYRESYRQGLEWVELRLDGVKYDFFSERTVGNLIARPVRKKRGIRINGARTNVRPYRHLVRDMEMVLEDDVSNEHKSIYRSKLNSLQRF